MSIQEIITLKYSGEPSFTYTYIQLASHAIGILIAGIILWRVNSMINNKRINQRKRSNFFETNYSKNWKK
jgi:hypothetical protein